LDSWRKRFHQVRRAAANQGTRRLEMFSSTVSLAMAHSRSLSPTRAGAMVREISSSFRSTLSKSTFGRKSSPDSTSDPKAKKLLSTVHSGEVPPPPALLKKSASLGAASVAAGASMGSLSGGANADVDVSDADVDHTDVDDAAALKRNAYHHSREFRKSKLMCVSRKSRNLCALTARLAAVEVLRDAAVVVRQKRLLVWKPRRRRLVLPS